MTGHGDRTASSNDPTSASRSNSSTESACRTACSHATLSTSWKVKSPATRAFRGGAYRDRTGDLRLAKPALSQLS